VIVAESTVIDGRRSEIEHRSLASAAGHDDRHARLLLIVIFSIYLVTGTADDLVNANYALTDPTDWTNQPCYFDSNAAQYQMIWDWVAQGAISNQGGRQRA
jgi:hypothetical protein